MFTGEIKFEIREQLGVLSNSFATTGVDESLELNIVSWNFGAPKFDLRRWNASHTRMSRGVTLHKEEMYRMLELVSEKENEIREAFKTDVSAETKSIDEEKGLEKEVSFRIIERVGVITTHPTGWQKELNVVSWNFGKPKIDLRDWDPAHEYMSKGITLTIEELYGAIKIVSEKQVEIDRVFNKENRDILLTTADELQDLVLNRFAKEEPNRELTNNEKDGIWYSIYGKLCRGEPTSTVVEWCKTVSLKQVEIDQALSQPKFDPGEYKESMLSGKDVLGQPEKDR